MMLPSISHLCMLTLPPLDLRNLYLKGFQAELIEVIQIS